MFYVHSKAGRIRAVHRDFIVAMEAMRAQGPGAEVRGRDGTVMATCRAWSNTQFFDRTDHPGEANPFGIGARTHFTNRSAA